MYRFVVLLSTALALATAQSTQVSQCVNHGGVLPSNTHIEGCSTPPCLLPQLQDAVINVDFEAPYAIQSMRTRATAYMRIGLITLPIAYDLGDNSVTCNFLTNASCPVEGGQALQYTLRMPIEPFFLVGTQVTIEFRVEDDNNVPVLCLRVPVTIVAPIV